MIDISKLPDDILIAVRGASESADAEIEQMTPDEFLRWWAYWKLGSRGWADSFLYVQEKVNNAVVNEARP